MTCWTNPSVENAIDFLNELVEIDSAAIAALIDHRVPCNEQLADHPTVQVGETDTGCVVGMLGILNGLFGTNVDGWGFITATFDNGVLLGFHRAYLDQCGNSE